MKSFHHTSLVLPPRQSSGRSRRQKERTGPVETSKELEPCFLELTRSLAARAFGHELEALEHAAHALRLGETAERFHELPDWIHSRLFTREEKAALSFVESLLVLHSEEEFKIALSRASRRLEHSQLLELIFAVFAIAEWERPGVARAH